MKFIISFFICIIFGSAIPFISADMVAGFIAHPFFHLITLAAVFGLAYRSLVSRGNY